MDGRHGGVFRTQEGAPLAGRAARATPHSSGGGGGVPPLSHSSHPGNWKAVHVDSKRFFIRKDGICREDPKFNVHTTADPRSRLARFRTWESHDLPVPVFALDNNSVLPPPKYEVSIYGLNDNVDRSFLHDMCGKVGTVSEAIVYRHPRTNKHLGMAFVKFVDAQAARAFIVRYDKSSVMGSIITCSNDPYASTVSRRFEEITMETAPIPLHLKCIDRSRLAEWRKSILSPQSEHSSLDAESAPCCSGVNLSIVKVECDDDEPSFPSRIQSHTPPIKVEPWSSPRASKSPRTPYGVPTSASGAARSLSPMEAPSIANCHPAPPLLPPVPRAQACFPPVCPPPPICPPPPACPSLFHLPQAAPPPVPPSPLRFCLPPPAPVVPPPTALSRFDPPPSTMFRPSQPHPLRLPFAERPLRPPQSSPSDHVHGLRAPPGEMKPIVAPFPPPFAAPPVPPPPPKLEKIIHPTVSASSLSEEAPMDPAPSVTLRDEIVKTQMKEKAAENKHRDRSSQATEKEGGGRRKRRKRRSSTSLSDFSQYVRESSSEEESSGETFQRNSKHSKVDDCRERKRRRHGDIVEEKRKYYKVESGPEGSKYYKKVVIRTMDESKERKEPGGMRSQNSPELVQVERYQRVVARYKRRNESTAHTSGGDRRSGRGDGSGETNEVDLPDLESISSEDDGENCRSRVRSHLSPSTSSPFFSEKRGEGKSFGSARGTKNCAQRSRDADLRKDRRFVERSHIRNFDPRGQKKVRRMDRKGCGPRWSSSSQSDSVTDSEGGYVRGRTQTRLRTCNPSHARRVESNTFVRSMKRGGDIDLKMEEITESSCESSEERSTSRGSGRCREAKGSFADAASAKRKTEKSWVEGLGESPGVSPGSRSALPNLPSGLPPTPPTPNLRPSFDQRLENLLLGGPSHDSREGQMTNSPRTSSTGTPNSNRATPVICESSPVVTPRSVDRSQPRTPFQRFDSEPILTQRLSVEQWSSLEEHVCNTLLAQRQLARSDPAFSVIAESDEVKEEKRRAEEERLKKEEEERQKEEKERLEKLAKEREAAEKEAERVREEQERIELQRKKDLQSSILYGSFEEFYKDLTSVLVKDVKLKVEQICFKNVEEIFCEKRTKQSPPAEASDEKALSGTPRTVSSKEMPSPGKSVMTPSSKNSLSEMVRQVSAQSKADMNAAFGMDNDFLFAGFGRTFSLPSFKKKKPESAIKRSRSRSRLRSKSGSRSRSRSRSRSMLRSKSGSRSRSRSKSESRSMSKSKSVRKSSSRSSSRDEGVEQMESDHSDSDVAVHSGHPNTRRISSDSECSSEKENALSRRPSVLSRRSKSESKPASREGSVVSTVSDGSATESGKDDVDEFEDEEETESEEEEDSDSEYDSEDADMDDEDEEEEEEGNENRMETSDEEVINAQVKRPLKSVVVDWANSEGKPSEVTLLIDKLQIASDSGICLTNEVKVESTSLQDEKPPIEMVVRPPIVMEKQEMPPFNVVLDEKSAFVDVKPQICETKEDVWKSGVPPMGMKMLSSVVVPEVCQLPKPKLQRKRRFENELASLLPPPVDAVHFREVHWKSEKVWELRSEEIEKQILVDFIKKGLDEEDTELTERKFHEMLTNGSANWCRTRFWVPVKIPQPKLLAKPRRVGKHENYFADPELDGIVPHSTGCARTQGYYKVSNKQKRGVLRRPDAYQGQTEISERDKTTMRHQVQASREARSLARRLQTTMGGDTNSEIFRGNQLKFRKKMIKFARSRIHGWGLYALEDIGPDEMIVEYVGQKVRPTVADEREKRYERRGMGSSYLFRIDSDNVIDATQKGNFARFINHSCQPNCYAKVVTVDGDRRIVIYSKTAIEKGDEITYDYKFPIEDEKIDCLCGAPTCRGSLN